MTTKIPITHPHEFLRYQRSIIFLALVATKTILGKQTRVQVKHSLDKNLYCQVHGHIISPEILAQIEAEMNSLVDADLPIERTTLPIEEVMELFTQLGYEDKVKNLHFRRSSSVNVYKLKDYYNYFYGKLAQTTGQLSDFALIKYKEGFLLQLADEKNEGQLRTVRKLDKISQVYDETYEWAKILGVETVGALNEKIATVGLDSVIKTNEALHEKRMVQIADQIHQGHKKIVFIAGPTSSGKTTFAHRLGIQLRVHGLEPFVVSLDNYYKNREDLPYDEHGELDLESIAALDVDCINEDLLKLSQGEPVDIPKYDFKSGKKSYKGNPYQQQANSILIVEGIHGLNETIGASVDEALTFKIFISPLTQLSIDDHNRISTGDTRLIRRIVRDTKFRGFGARDNLNMWPSVQRGERLHIFPYQEQADAIFNSTLVYEISLLKPYVEPLLFAITKDQPEYTEARRLIKFLDSFLCISSEDIPQNSILREFIGGSSIHVH